ncbi:MAG: lipid II:glycine glycyltransferase FemX, partial [Acidobacteriaceae bacterium]
PVLSWVLDLNESEDLILAKMKPKHRYNLNLAIKKGVKIRQGNMSDLPIFLKLLKETAARNHFNLHPEDYYVKLFQTLYPDNIRMFVAELENRPLAALALTLFSDTAIYLHGGSSDRNKETMATYALQWEAIKFARASGMAKYDFGGIAPLSEPGHSWAGISRFKRGFGGREEASPGAFDLRVSKFWYNVYANFRKIRSFFKPKN